MELKNKLYNKVKEVASNSKELLQEKFEKFKEIVKNKLNKLYNKVKEVASNSKELLQEKFEKFKKIVTQVIKNYIEMLKEEEDRKEV